MSYVSPQSPNIADFTTFAIGEGVPSGDLPTTGIQWAQWALNMALDQTLGDEMGSVSSAYPQAYVLAVYNCAMHNLVKIGQDVSPLTYFTDTREAFKLSSFLGGVVLASGDETTSQTLAVPESLKQMTLRDLDYVKTPWGRQYLEFSQMYGPNVVIMV
jgi:hypothetical protein